MKNLADELRDRVVMDSVREGLGIGPVARGIAYFFNGPMGVAAVVETCLQGFWIAALCMVVASFTPFSIPLLSMAAGFLFWKGAILSGLMAILYVLGTMAAFQLGKREVRKLFDRGGPLLHELTGAPDLGLAQVMMCAGLGVAMTLDGWYRTAGIVLATVSALYGLMRFLHRSFPPWARIHYPTTFLSIAPSAQEFMRAKAEGRVPDREAVAIGTLERIWSGARAKEILERARDRGSTGEEVDGVTRALLQSRPNADPHELRSIVVDSGLFDRPGTIVDTPRAIAELVAVSFGPDERFRYFAALLEGKAR